MAVAYDGVSRRNPQEINLWQSERLPLTALALRQIA